VETGITSENIEKKLLFWLERALLEHLTIGKVVSAAGAILAGWSSRQWGYYEKEAKLSE
jgi:hypothetical protein